jgi:hypothetical protein
MLGAMGSVPVSTYHNQHLMLWNSKNGRDWAGHKTVGDSDFIVTSVREHEGAIYTYGRGSICGIAQTIRIESSRDATRFREASEKTFSGFFPSNASLVFHGDTGYCFMGRGKTGYLGIAKAPYNDWSWHDLEHNLTHPNSVRLFGGDILVSTGLDDEEVRTSLCWFDVQKKQLVEILVLPTSGEAQRVGLLRDKNDLLVSHHKVENGTAQVFLTKLKIEKSK